MEADRVHLAVVGDEGTLPERPRTRGECADIPRPCPFVSCKYHLYLEVNRRLGSITFNHAGEPEDLPADRSCALDVADEGGVTLAEAGASLGLTRERARQIEFEAFIAARESALKGRSVLGEFAESVDETRRPLTSGHAALYSDPVVDPFAECDEPDEELEQRIVSMFDGSDDAACDFVWEMFAKRYGIRSRQSLVASRYQASRRERVAAMNACKASDGVER